MTEPEISLAKPVMEVMDKVRQIVEDAYYAGKAKGRQEVVDFIGVELFEHNYSGLVHLLDDCFACKWQAKLKEWGIGE